MKKLVIATTVATACLLPLSAIAGTTLYGQLRYSVNSVDEDMGQYLDADDQWLSDDGLKGSDNVSLFGLKGEYGDNTKAFFHIQTGAKADKQSTAFGQRFFYGGLKGCYGSLAYGLMTNAYKMPGFKMDPFYNMSSVNAIGGLDSLIDADSETDLEDFWEDGDIDGINGIKIYSAGGANFGLSGATNGFTDNSLQYTTPKMGGLQLTAAVAIDDSNEDEHGMIIGGSWEGQGINAGVVFASEGESKDASINTLPGIMEDGDALRVYAGYTQERFKVGFSYESVDDVPDITDDTKVDSTDYLYLTGTYMIPSAKTNLSLSIGKFDNEYLEGLGYSLGAFYSITENTKLFALASFANIEGAESGDDFDIDPMVISIGAEHKFSIGTK